MNHPRIVSVIQSAVAAAHLPDVPLIPLSGHALSGHHASDLGPGKVPVASYTDGSRLALEREHLFRRLPIPIAHAAEIGRTATSGGRDVRGGRDADAATEAAAPGTNKNNVLVRSLDGVSLLLTRDADGEVRGFRNSCRHRGVRLLREDCRAKAFVCPYHGWTYGIDGALMHIPHPQAFPSCNRPERAAGSGSEPRARNEKEHALVPVHVEERHGLIWASLHGEAPMDRRQPAASAVQAHLGDAIDEELASLDLASHVVGGRVVTEQRGNWKMLMEAFLEGYHIRQLHRNSVYPFFLDARSVAEREGLHVRAASARRSAKEMTVDDVTRTVRANARASASDSDSDSDTPSIRSVRDIATVSYMLFPSTTLILHPDWTSLVVVQPLATDRFLWSHTQLLLEEPKTEEARAHFARSFALIEGNVFQKEDLLMCAEMQTGIETGANTTLTFGLLESPAIWLHDGIRSVLDDDARGSPRL